MTKASSFALLLFSLATAYDDSEVPAARPDAGLEKQALPSIVVLPDTQYYASQYPDVFLA